MNRFLIIILVLGFGSSFAQNANHAGLKYIQAAFEQKITGRHEEKVFVHTDRDTYLIGETVWFKAYCLDAATHLPSSVFQVLNMELLSSDGRPAKQMRIKLNEGIGKGQLLLTGDLPTGKYVLRAYTQWMMNQDENFFFNEELVIINPRASVKTKNGDAKDFKLMVDVFPEGGDLVSDIETKLAIKVSDKRGKGYAVRGNIVDDDGQETAHFETNELGFDAIDFNPEKGESYQIQIIDSLYAGNARIPDAKDTGVIMNIQQNSQWVSILLKSSTEEIQSYYLFAHTRGVIQERQLVATSGSIPTKVMFDKSYWPAGITHITLLSLAYQPVCERLVFKYPEGQSDLDLLIEQENFVDREKVSFDINGLNVPANLSVAVYKNPVQGGEIVNQVLPNIYLTSDIKGHIQNAFRYFDESNEHRAEDLDLLLMTQGWRRFEWSHVLDTAVLEYEYFPETQSPVISGRLEMPAEEMPATLMAIFPGKQSLIMSYPLTEDGKFFYQVPYRINSDRILFSVPNATLDHNNINIANQLSDKLGYKVLDTSLDQNLESYLSHAYENVQISQIYQKQTNVNGIKVIEHNRGGSFYGEPDRSYILDDFTRFKTMRDLFLEYIRTAVIRKKKKVEYIQVVEDEFEVTPALILIDGIPIDSASHILDYDPLEIEQIDVIEDYYSINGMKVPGLINFITYKGNSAATDDFHNYVEKDFFAIRQPRQFYSPKYETDERTRIPDFRTLLYWNPDVDLSAGANYKLDFFTGDDTGEYVIEIVGFDSKGRPIHEVESIAVQKGPLK